jgi:glycosyltransferase involved in cell wall biosynthesis
VKRVLIVSPHFPPDNGAASHRMRLLAPRLASHGWEPTVVAADPADLPGGIEPGLLDLVHGPLRVERVRALGGATGRFLGVGDLGLRTLRPLYLCCRELLRTETYDAVLITCPPHYSALLGPLLFRVSGVPYILDYQDPWVSAWGVTVGGANGGGPDWKSRLTHWLAGWLEPYAVRRAAGFSSVSEGTLDGVFERHPSLQTRPTAEIPLGGEALDFRVARERPRPNAFFDPFDGMFHLVYVGTLPPVGGLEVLRAFFGGLAHLLDERPELRSRLRLHFLGTSMRHGGDPPEMATPLAEEAAIGECVREHPLRIGYLDALSVLTQADAVLLLGGTEPHYTASRVYPALLSGAPLLAVYHEASTVCDVLRERGRAGAVQLVTFGNDAPPSSVIAPVSAALSALTSQALSGTDATPDLGEWAADSLAGRLADCLDRATLERIGA